MVMVMVNIKMMVKNVNSEWLTMADTDQDDVGKINDEVGLKLLAVAEWQWMQMKCCKVIAQSSAYGDQYICMQKWGAYSAWILFLASVMIWE